MTTLSESERYMEMVKVAFDLVVPSDMEEIPTDEQRGYISGMAQLIVNTTRGAHGFDDASAATEALVSILSGGRL